MQKKILLSICCQEYQQSSAYFFVFSDIKTNKKSQPIMKKITLQILAILIATSCSDNFKKDSHPSSPKAIVITYGTGNTKALNNTGTKVIPPPPTDPYNVGYAAGCYAAQNASETAQVYSGTIDQIGQYNLGWAQGFKDCSPAPVSQVVVPPSGGDGGCLEETTYYDEIAGQYFTYYTAIECPTTPPGPAKQ
jgi:hypothetical protein